MLEADQGITCQMLQKGDRLLIRRLPSRVLLRRDDVVLLLSEIDFETLYCAITELMTLEAAGNLIIRPRAPPESVVEEIRRELRIREEKLRQTRKRLLRQTIATAFREMGGGRINRTIQHAGPTLKPRDTNPDHLPHCRKDYP